MSRVTSSWRRRTFFLPSQSPVKIKVPVLAFKASCTPMTSVPRLMMYCTMQPWDAATTAVRFGTSMLLREGPQPARRGPVPTTYTRWGRRGKWTARHRRGQQEDLAGGGRCFAGAGLVPLHVGPPRRGKLGELAAHALLDVGSIYNFFQTLFCARPQGFCQAPSELVRTCRSVLSCPHIVGDRFSAEELLIVGGQRHEALLSRSKSCHFVPTLGH